MDENTKFKGRDVDSGWAWIVLGACFMTNLIISFENYSAGVLQVILLEKFQEGNTATSLVGSIFGSAMCLSGPFIGMLINITSCRFTVIFGGILMTVGFFAAFFAKSLTVITVTHGLIAGIGSGFCSIPSYVMIGYSFDRFRGISIGVVVAGGGIGLMFSGPFMQYLLDTYGLSGTYLIMAGISAELVVLGALMKPSETEIKQHKEMRQRKFETDKSCSINNIFSVTLLTNVPFLFFIVSVFLYYAATNIVFIHLPNFAVMKGSSELAASMLMLHIGIGSTFSRLLSGLLTSRAAELDPFLLSIGSLGLSAILALTFPLYSLKYWQQSLFAVLFGIYNSGFIAFLNFVCLAIVGIAKFSSAYGLIYFTNGIGYLVGPTLAGFLIDETGNYEVVFFLSGTCFTCAVFMILLSSTHRAENAEKTQTTDDTHTSEGSKFLHSVLTESSSSPTIQV